MPFVIYYCYIFLKPLPKPAGKLISTLQAAHILCLYILLLLFTIKTSAPAACLPPGNRISSVCNIMVSTVNNFTVTHRIQKVGEGERAARAEELLKNKDLISMQRSSMQRNTHRGRVQ